MQHFLAQLLNALDKQPSVFRETVFINLHPPKKIINKIIVIIIIAILAVVVLKKYGSFLS